jgi:hypothetical protein
VLVEVDAEVHGAVDDVIAIDLAGKGFVLHPLSHRLGVDFGERLARLDQRDGGESMLAQALGLGELSKQFPGLLSRLNLVSPLPC